MVSYVGVYVDISFIKNSKAIPRFLCEANLHICLFNVIQRLDCESCVKFLFTESFTWHIKKQDVVNRVADRSKLTLVVQITLDHTGYIGSVIYHDKMFQKLFDQFRVQ